MPKPKTQPTRASVRAFLAAVGDAERRADAKRLLAWMREVTAEKPTMFGPSIVGFGRYQSATGSWPLVAFSPRRANLVVYVMPGFANFGALLTRLGPHKRGKSCLYLRRLADVDAGALRELIRLSVAAMREKHGSGVTPVRPRPARRAPRARG
jgi:hypothetical protein